MRNLNINRDKKILFILFIVIFIDYASSVFISPFLPELLQELTKENITNNSIWAGIMMMGYSAMQFIFAPIIGALSDKYGRKPLIILSLITFGINYIIMVYANNIYILILLRLILGISGASMAIVLASISDFSEGENRVKNVSIIYSGIGSALIFGPLIGSFLSFYNNRVPFLCAGIFSILTAIICYFFLPETLNKNKRKNFKFINPLLIILDIAKYKNLTYLMIIHLFFAIAFETPFTLWAFYTIYKLNWSKFEIGLSLVYIGVLICLVQIYITKYVYVKIGQIKCILLGLLFFSLGSFIIGLAKNNIWIYIGLLFYSLGGIYNSPMINFFTLSVSEKEQGKLQGVISSINSLALIISPLMMTWIFKYSINNKVLFENSNPFYLSSILFLISITIVILVFKKKKL